MSNVVPKRATENVDVGRGLTECRLLTGAQAWNNYYWLVERYWREYVNYLRKLRIHAQKTKSRSKDEITLGRQLRSKDEITRFNIGISIKKTKSRSKDEITLKR